MQYLLSYGKTILPGITFVLGLLAKHIFDLWRNRIPKIRYQIFKSFLGASAQDQRFGSVQILYNSQPIQNLYMVRISLQNTSVKDFSNLEMLLWCNVGSLILVSSGFKQNSINPLSLTEDYLSELANTTPETMQHVYERRRYKIPVLNRDDAIEFSCLLTNNAGAEPDLYLQCEHEGLKLEAQFVQPQLLLGEPQHLATFLGIAITGVLLVPVVTVINSVAVAAIVAWLAGLACVLPGIAILKLLKHLRKLTR